MEYMTVQEAAEKWGLSARRVQYLCSCNAIPGAAKFGRVWTIPGSITKPKDGRYKADGEKWQAPSRSFQSPGGNEWMLSKIVDFFPYPIQVYSPDGTLVSVNEAALRLMHIPSKDQLVGKFNVLKDPVIDDWGEDVRKRISKSFQGETIQFQDLEIPIRGIISRFGTNELYFGNSFQNITCFPIRDDNNQVAYVVHVFVTTKLYNGKDEMVRAKEYMEEHWLEPFDLDKVARAVNLSRYHFSRLFKRYTLITPYSYYHTVKINKLKEKLYDKNLSIGAAFSACGVAYNGHYARLFKVKVGMTPSQFRKTLV